MQHSPLTRHLSTAVPYLVLALAFVLLASRSVYSFCWLDESFYLSLVDGLYKGAVPFVDEWHPAQVYAPLLLPLYSAYVTATGGTEGVIYFFRMAYLLLAFAVSLATHKVLARSFGEGVGLAAALCYLFYVRANIQGPSYYSLCTTFFLLGLLCSWCTWLRARADDGSASTARVVLPVAAGAFFALAVCCNPYVVFIVVIAFVVAVALAALRHDGRILTPFAWGLCGCLVVGCCYLLFLLGRTDPALLVANLGNVLGSHDENLTFAERIPNYLGWLPVSRVGFAGTALLTVALIITRALRHPLTPRAKLAVLVADALLFALTCYVALATSLHPNKVFIAFVEFAVPCYLLTRDLHLRAHPEVLLFWLPGVLLSLVWQFSSNTQVCGIIIGYSIACLGAFITVAQLCGELAAEDAATPSTRLALASRTVAAACVIAVVVLTAGIRVTSVYSDCTFSEMTTQIESGPAAGLLTSAQHAAEYEGVRALAAHIDDDGPVWIAPMAPWAYLEADGACAATSTWNTFMGEEDAATYYGEQSHAYPTWILVTNDDLGASVNVVAGRVHAFPALEMYREHTATLRSTLEASSEYAPVASSEYGTLYKRASAPRYLNAAG